MLSHPIQTNEPSRSAALIVGSLDVAARTQLPLHVLEPQTICHPKVELFMNEPKSKTSSWVSAPPLSQKKPPPHPYPSFTLRLCI